MVRNMETQDDRYDIETPLRLLKRMWEEKLPFNRILGFKVVSIDRNTVRVGMDMKPELVGNYLHGTLHGGVISAVLDATGGMNAAAGVLHKMEDRPMKEVEGVLTRMGTIDLRVDYLRPGRGRRFFAHSSIMRAGNKVAVTRMEFLNEQDLLIAVGTGTYLVG